MTVTRLQQTADGRPGSRTRVDYQLASKSPVESLEVLVDGKVVSTKGGPGVKLNDDAGQWFTAPDVGTHKVSVRARNAFGCVREETSFFDLVVR